MSTSHDRIARRAYEIFQARGEQHGEDWADWFQAERHIRLTEPTLDELIARIPSALFKYSGLDGERLEWMRRLIVDSQLFFTPPRYFNDPLDFRITPSFDAPREVVEQHWGDVAIRVGGQMSEDEREARVKTLIEQSSTRDGQAEFTRKLFDMMANHNGTVCLATDPVHMLMWSYYADSHRGIAVRFGTDLDQIIALGRALNAQGTDLYLIDVDYANEFPHCNYYTSSKYERNKTLLGTKSSVWSHEGEWRIVLPGRTGYLNVPPQLITGIVLGLRTHADVEAKIRGWLANRDPAVELLRVVHKPNSFRLELAPA
jgi:DUF2934 family protein/DUF2971 family protein